jgi:L-ascorbate metabolism protein UlaG (beta-lactamase superfamily)
MLQTKGNRITYFGHSTFSLITPGGQVALIDP